MLATGAIVEAVAAAIEELDLPLVVLDPVLVSSSGSRLLDDDGVAALREALIPLARVVTPNIPEAEALSGVRITTPADARAGQRPRARPARSLLGIALACVVGRGVQLRRGDPERVALHLGSRAL